MEQATQASRREKDDHPESWRRVEQATQAHCHEKANLWESLIAGASQRGKTSRRGKA